METIIYIDLNADDYKPLSKIHKRFETIEVEYTSGITGLEIIGTLIIPSIALCFQIISFIEQLKEKKHKSIVIKKIDIRINNSVVYLSDNPSKEDIEKTMEKLL
jgi:hypothetical protein